MAINVGCIAGSLSATSINRKLLRGLESIEAETPRDPGETLVFREIAIDRLGMYDRDLDGDYPREAVELKDQIRGSDALIIATPEYNRSIPGVLKNAIDWASRPYGDSAFTGKPVGVIGASVGAIGTALAQQHLRNILAYLDAPVMGQPEAFIQFSPERFGDDGTVLEASTRDFLARWLDAFRTWAGRFAPPPTGG